MGKAVMTAEQVQNAVDTLKAQGTIPSSRNILKLLRRTPPRYMGGSFRDLLPLLKPPPLPSPAAHAIQALLAMADRFEAAVTMSRGARDRLLLQGEALRAEWTPLLTAMHARGEPVDSFREAFVRLSEASSRLIWGGRRPW